MSNQPNDPNTPKPKRVSRKPLNRAARRAAEAEARRDGGPTPAQGRPGAASGVPATSRAAAVPRKPRPTPTSASSGSARATGQVRASVASAAPDAVGARAPRPKSSTRSTGAGPASRVEVFAVCAPGLEPFVAAELNRAGAASVTERHGGVSCTASWSQVWQLNLWSRCASRILLRIARFSAPNFADFEAGLRRIEWSSWLPSEGTVSVSGASTNSAIYHTGAIEERAMLSLTSRTGLVAVDDVTEVDTEFDDDDDASPLAVTPKRQVAGSSVLIRIISDQVTVSIDSSGEPLYKRGWREAVAKAPIRETLAAGLLVASGWDGKAPLIDPFCGSGTVAIEAMLLARRIAPGRHREFAFQTWPSFEQARWDRLVGAADADVVDRRPIVIGADRDAGAIAAARSNAARAGVAELIEWREASISDLVVPKGRVGVIATNPPYGQRVGGVAPGRDGRAVRVGGVGTVGGSATSRSGAPDGTDAAPADESSSKINRSSNRPEPVAAPRSGGRDIDADLRNLYDRWGRVMSDVAPGWTVAVVAQPGPLLDRVASRAGMTMTPVATTSNGGIPVVFARGMVAGKTAAAPRKAAPKPVDE
jgi:putative N6-adenine-specific DNA methylase